MSSRPLHNLSDVDLTTLCLQHDRRAWEEFFRRFSPVIKKATRRTFIRHGSGDLGNDIDVISDIHLVIVEKLYAKGALKQCHDLSGLRSWLIRIAANETIGWLRHRGRVKHLPQFQEEKLMLHLSAPLGEDPDFSLLDVIEDEDSGLDARMQQVATKLYAERVLEQAETIENVSHRWILRLSILGLLPLSPDEVEALQSVSPLPQDELFHCLSDMEKSVVEREMERQQGLGKTVLYWHQLRRLEAALSRLRKESTSGQTPEIERLEHEYIDLGSKRKKLLAECRKFPRPENREIARIVGIPEENCGNVSQYIKRAREALIKKMSAFSVSE